MPTNPPLSPLPGAVYVDQSTNIAWVWTGTYWLQAYGGSTNYSSQQTPTTSIIPGYYAEPSPDSWFPSVGATAPAYPSCGQIWVDNSVTPNYAQVWDCNTNAWIQLGGTAGGDTNSIVSAAAPATRVSGEALVDGDLWIQPAVAGTSNTVLYYRELGIWRQATESDTHSIYSTTPPSTRLDSNLTPRKPGDIWIDPDDNSLYYWNSTTVTWTPVVAIDNDHVVQNSAVLGVPTTRTDGTPLLANDLWTDTSTNSLHYRTTGGAWVKYNDTHSQYTGGSVAPTTRDDGTAHQGGDQWFDPVNDNLYVWDPTKGASGDWVIVTSTDTHSIWSTTNPAQNNSGGALVAGDLWTNSTLDVYNRHEVKVYNGTAWERVGTQDTHSFTNTDHPNAGSTTQQTTRNDGSSLVVGDLYIDTTTKKSYYYTGAGLVWEEFGSDTHSFINAGAPGADIGGGAGNRVDGSPLLDGDQYIDTVTGEGYYYNTATTSWNLFGADTHAIVNAGVPVAGVTTRDDGTAVKQSDTYFNRSTGEVYFYDAGAWVLGSNNTHSIVAVGAPVAGVTTRVNTSPTQDGDLYIDSSTKSAYYYNSASVAWIPFGTDTHSFTGAGLPAATLPSAGAQRPDGTAVLTGDEYIDTATDLLYYYNGTAWEQVASGSKVFVANAAPADRGGGVTDPLLNGDLWYDTSTTPATNYYYDGGTSSWKNSGDVTVVAAVPATAGYADQLIVNSTTNRMYRYDTTAVAWIQVV